MYARSSFLLLLRLRRFIVFGEGIWRCTLCNNSVMDFFWVVKLPWVHIMASGYFFLFKCHSVALCMIFKGFQVVIILVSFCDLGIEFYTQEFIKFLWCHLFQDIFKMAGLAPALEDVHSLFCVAWCILTMFIHSNRVELLCCFIWNYRKPGNIYLLEMALNLLLCVFLFVAV